MSNTPLESDLETKFVELVNDDENFTKKGKGIVGWPDREVYLNNGHIFFIELKRLGEEPRKIQYHIMDKLKELGYHVFWTDNFKEAKRIYEQEKVFANGLQKKGRTKRS